MKGIWYNWPAGRGAQAYFMKRPDPIRIPYHDAQTLVVSEALDGGLGVGRRTPAIQAERRC